jgi:hypothetical protein
LAKQFSTVGVAGPPSRENERDASVVFALAVELPIDATKFTLALSPGHEVTSCVSTFASRPQIAAPHLQASAFSKNPFVLAHFIICSHTPEDSWQNAPVPGMLTLFSTVVHVCPMTLQVIDGDPVQGWCPSTSTFMPDTVMFN